MARYRLILSHCLNPRSSHQKRSMKKGVLRNFTNFTGKHLCQSLFFNKVDKKKFIKKRLWCRCFPVNFAKFPRTPFLQSTSGRLFLESFPSLQTNTLSASIYLFKVSNRNTYEILFHNVWNMFKVNYKDTTLRPLTLFWCLY